MATSPRSARWLRSGLGEQLVSSIQLILASGSPRRQQLLSEAGYDFAVVRPSDDAECGVCSGETPVELVARLALQKAADVTARVRSGQVELEPQRRQSGIVLGCDTVAAWRGQVFGKPAHEEHARQILTSLSGRDHEVYSGLCLVPLAGGEPRVEVDRTTLRMAELSEPQLAEYLASGLWDGKAGAFGYQDRTGWLEIVSGSESNVVGLPLERLALMLEAWP